MKLLSAIAVCAGNLLSVAPTCNSANLERNPSMGEMAFIWESYPQANRLLTHLGYTNYSFRGVGRDPTAGRLFMHIQTSGSNLLVVVSTRTIQIENLYGAATDLGQHPYWLDQSKGKWEFANGGALPAKSYYVWACAGDFVVVEEKDRALEWISRAATPLVPVISFPQDVWGNVQIFPRGDLLDIARLETRTKSPAGGQERVLTLETYSGMNGTPKLQRRKVFPWASSVFDVHPSGSLAVLRPQKTYMARGVLVDLDTGRELKLGFASDYGVFLKEDLARRIVELERGPK